MNPGNEDDVLPPPPTARDSRNDEAIAARDDVSRRTSRFLLGDRALFVFGGLVLGFTLGWLSLEKVPFQSARALAEDPPARLTDVGPGARDLPSASGSAASTSTVLMARRRIRELEQAAGRSPNDYGLLVQLGNASYDAEDWQRAVETYERAVKIKSDDANVLTDLGISHRNLGHIDRAIELFDHAIRADPKHWPALFNLAIVYGLDKGDVSKANAILRTLKKEHPDVQSLDRLEKTLEAKGRNAR